MSGVPNYNPARSTPLLGLKHVLAIDDGTSAHLLAPGNTGYGLQVWDMSKYCGGCGDTVTTWLLPTIVRWTSLTGPDGLIHQDVAEVFLDDSAPDGPLVGINELWVPEMYEDIHFSETASGNLDMTDECEGDGECVGVYTYSGHLLGVTPVFNVVPIDTSFMAAWLPRLRKAWAKDNEIFENYGMCTCSFDSWEDDSCLVYQWDKMHEADRHTAWNNSDILFDRWTRESNCNCSYHAFIRGYWELVSNTPDYIDDVNDPLLEQTWEYALDRYFTSWKWLSLRAPNYTETNERNLWLSYYSRRWSPYLVRSGLAEYLRDHGLLQYAA